MINEEHAEYKKCPQCQWWWVATATAAVVTSDIPQQQTGKQQTNSAFNFAAIYLLSLLLGPVPAKEPAVRVKARSTPEPAQESRTTSRPNHNQLLPLVFLSSSCPSGALMPKYRKLQPKAVTLNADLRPSMSVSPWRSAWRSRSGFSTACLCRPSSSEASQNLSRTRGRFCLCDVRSFVVLHLVSICQFIYSTTYVSGCRCLLRFCYMACNGTSGTGFT